VKRDIRLGLAHALLARAERPEIFGCLGNVLTEKFKDDPSMILTSNTARDHEGLMQ